MSAMRSVIERPVSQLSSAEKAERKEMDIIDEELGTAKSGRDYIHEDDISPEQKRLEAKVLRKVDYRLIPILGLLYSVAGLDRVNLFNARVAGLNKDSRLDSGDLMYECCFSGVSVH